MKTPKGRSSFARACSALASFLLVLLLVRTANAASEATCTIERAVGLSDADVEAVEDVVCAEIRQLTPERRSAFASYKIRLSKLGGKVVLTLTGERNGARTERQLILTGVDEVTVAAPRLVDALVNAQTVAETQNVTNIVGEEARTPKKKSSEVHFALGAIGVAAPGAAAHAGAHMAFSAGSDTWSFVVDARVAGNAFLCTAHAPITFFTLGMVKPDLDADLSFTSLAAGTRYHTSTSEHAPFVGIGLGWEQLMVKADHEQRNSGLAGYGEVGLDFLRASRVGGTLALRVDAPAFALAGTKNGNGPRGSFGPPAPASSPAVNTKAYYPVIGASFSLRF